MTDIRQTDARESSPLCDDIAEALEQAGLWRRAAARWLVIFDQMETDYARECAVLRREACLLMSTDDAEGDTGAKRRKFYRMLLEKQRRSAPQPGINATASGTAGRGNR